MKVLLFSLILLLASVHANVMNKVVLSAKGDALCLDGTPGAYYISEGVGENRTKFVLFFEGGGWCGGTSQASTLESCYQRSLQGLGSSASYPATMDVTHAGILSGQQADNPGFYDWTKVYLKYCDGSGHQGTRSQPISYKNKTLYFRGQNVTIGQLNGVDATHKLWTEATDILVSGCSAGGLAAFTWTNYIAGKAKGKVYSAPDSGIFLDAANVKSSTHIYRNEFINLMTYSNAEVETPVPECHKDYPNQPWRCMFAQNLHKYIKVPLFPVESLYDSWSVPNILGLSCISSSSLQGCNQTERDILDVYRKSTQTVLKDITSRQGNGAWSPACSNHCYMHATAWTNAQTFSVPKGTGNTIHKSVHDWYLKIKSSDGYTHVDSEPWPANTGCAGQHSLLTQ